MSKNLGKKTESFVQDVFEEVYGFRPSKVRDFAGKKPQESNYYLFNPMMSMFEGLATQSSLDYMFSIHLNPDTGKWEYDIQIVGNKQ